MAVTVIINMLTASHKGSSGISTAFPDLCKTPSPGGPIPIPYPNIAMSSDTSKGSKKVKMDGKSIMLKSSKISTSSGDEAGSAQGVVSNKIKGKGKFVNYSFDVMVEGKNVCRLSDPTQQNCASMNTAAFFHMQKPDAATSEEQTACEAVKDREQKTKSGPQGETRGSGIIPTHLAAIKRAVNGPLKKYVLYFRKTNPLCAPWIAAGHAPKPHSVINAKTIKNPGMLQAMESWCNRNPRQDASILATASAIPMYGVVTSMFESAKGRPLHRGELWITGDYDLMDITCCNEKCKRPTEEQFGQIKSECNKAMEWKGIQHPPQAQWVARTPKDYSDFSMPEEVSAWVNGGGMEGDPPKLKKKQIAADVKIPIVDGQLTVIAPDGCTIYLKTTDDYKDALICNGCKDGSD